MGNYFYLYNRFYFLLNLGFAFGISVRVSIKFLDLAYFPRINYFVYSCYFLNDYLVNIYLLIGEQIENSLLLCDLFSDRFEILLVLLVLSLFYLFSRKTVNGTLLDPSKYGTISKASRRDTCWFIDKFVISVNCIGRLLFGKLFAEISLSDFLEVE